MRKAGRRSSAPGSLNVTRKEAWLFCRTSFGVRLCWELEEPKGPKPKGSIRKQKCFLCSPFYGRACRLAMSGDIKTSRVGRTLLESMRTRSSELTQNPTKGLEDYPLATRREPSALEGSVLEILCCGLKGRRAFLRILSTGGRGIRLCWAKSKPRGPKGPNTAKPQYMGTSLT